MNYVLKRVLIPEAEIADRVRLLGEQIGRDYSGQQLVMVGILKGAVVFLSDLARQVPESVDVSLDFMAVSSYGDSTKTSGIVKIVKDLDISVKDRNVLIVEDIVDTGLTLSYLVKVILEREPRSVRVCVLLDKEERRKAPVRVDYRGFAIPDEFVVGYGLDCAGKWRNLPSIHVVDDQE